MSTIQERLDKMRAAAGAEGQGAIPQSRPRRDSSLYTREPSAAGLVKKPAKGPAGFARQFEANAEAGAPSHRAVVFGERRRSGMNELSLQGETNDMKLAATKSKGLRDFGPDVDIRAYGGQLVKQFSQEAKTDVAQAGSAYTGNTGRGLTLSQRLENLRGGPVYTAPPEVEWKVGALSDQGEQLAARRAEIEAQVESLTKQVEEASAAYAEATDRLSESGLRDEESLRTLGAEQASLGREYNRLQEALAQAKSDAYFAEQEELRFNTAQAQLGAEDVQAIRERGLERDFDFPRANRYDSVREALEYFRLQNAGDSERADALVHNNYGYYRANQMSDEQRDTLLYLTGMRDYDGAQKYLEGIEYQLNEAANGGFQEDMSQWAQEHPGQGAMANIFSWPMAIPAWVDNAGEMLRQGFTGEYRPPDPNRDAYLGARFGMGTSQGVQNAAREAAVRTFGSETAGDVAAFLTGAGLSIGQNVTQIAAMGPFSLLGMGLSSAGTVTTDALDRGATHDQAFFIGTSAGLIEAATEKIPLDNLFRIAGQGGKRAAKELVADVLKQSGMEATEEMVSEIANNLVDAAVMGQSSEYQGLIRELLADNPGMTEQEAEKRAFLQLYVYNVLLSGVGGGLSGGVMGGSAALFSQAGEYVKTLTVRNSAHGAGSGNTASDTPSPDFATKKTIEYYFDAGDTQNSWRDRTYTQNGKIYVQSQDRQRVYMVPNQSEIMFSVSEDGLVSLKDDVVSQLDKSDYRDFVKAYAELNLVTKIDPVTGRTINPKPIIVKSTRTPVLITQTGINDVAKKIRGAGIKNQDNVSSLLLLDKLIENSDPIKTSDNYHGNPNLFSYYNGKFEIGGRIYNVTLHIKNVPEGDRYYYHALDKIEVTPTYGSPADGGTYQEMKTTSFNATIAQSDAGVKNEGMQDSGEVFTPTQQAQNRRRLAGALEAFGPQGRTQALAFYDSAGQEPSAYYGGFAAYYQAGVAGLAMDKVQSRYAGALNRAQRQAAYLAGQMDGKRAVEQTVSLRYTNLNDNLEGASVSDGETVHLRNSGQRAGSARTGGQVSQVAQSAGGAQVRSAQGRAADSEASRLSYGEAVSTASLGIGAGSTKANIHVVTGGTTQATEAARKLAKERGLRLVLFTGDNLHIRGENGKVESVRGYISGDRVFVRADHPLYTAEQIMRHEAGHDMIKRGEVDVETVRERIAETFGKEKTEALAQLYMDAYEGSGLSAEEVWEEVICDSLGDMNVFAARLDSAAPAAWELLREARKATEAARKAPARAPPSASDTNVGGKMSRENGYKKVSQQAWRQIQRERMSRYGDHFGTMPRMDAFHAHDMLFVVKNFDETGFGVVEVIDPAKHQAKANIVWEVMKNGDIENASSYRRRLENLRRWRGRYAGGSLSAQDPGTGAGDAGLYAEHGKTGKTDKTAGESGGVGEVKAKFSMETPVEFDEDVAELAPSDAPADLIADMEGRGINVLTYEAGNKEKWLSVKKDEGERDSFEVLDAAGKTEYDGFELTAEEEAALQGYKLNGAIDPAWKSEFDADGNPIFARTKEEANVQPTNVAEDKKMRAKFAKMFGLEKNEASRLENYVGGLLCYPLNKKLVKDVPLTDGEKGIVQSIRNALLKFPAYSGRTYRNQRYHTEREYNAFLAEYTTGNTVTWKGFTSTSKRPNGYPLFGDGLVHMVVDGISGRDIADTYGIPRQQEVTYLPGVQMKVMQVTTANDGRPLIYLQEVVTDESNPGEDGENSGNRRSEQSVSDAGIGQGASAGRSGEDSGKVYAEVRSDHERDGLLPERREGSDGRNVSVTETKSEQGGLRGDGERQKEPGVDSEDAAQRQSAQSIRAAVEAEGIQAVSTASQGIGIGTDNRTLKVVPASLWTDKMRKASREQAGRGRQVIYFTGELEVKDGGKPVRARGAASPDGKRIWVRADHDSLSVEQIIRDEEQRLKMARFIAEDGAATEGEPAPATNRPEGGPAEARLSLKYWRPRLTKSEWSLLNRKMEQEIERPDCFIDEATKWVYANEKGTAVFAFYGIGDGTDNTPLYASGGKQAAADARAMNEYLEERKNGTKRRAEAVDRLLKYLKNKRGTSSSNLYGNARARGGDVSVSKGQSERDGQGGTDQGTGNRGNVKGEDGISAENAEGRFTDGPESDIISIGNSLGAKAKNYEVMDLDTGERFEFAEGSKIQDIQVFAGKDSRVPYRRAAKYAELYGGRFEDWQHAKGFGLIATPDGDRAAEVHWSQCEGVGKFDFFVKEWLD